MEHKGDKKKIGLGILAGLTSLSVLIGSVFDSSKDLLEDTHVSVKAISETMTDLSEDNLESGKQKQGFKERVRRMIYKVPVRVRVVLFLPLWLLGNLILIGAEFLFRTVLAPIGNLILGFILQTLLLLGIIAVCIKIMFPDLPWSKIFSKKLILLVFAGSLFMSACDFVMPMIWEKYTLYRRISKLILGLIVILIILGPFIRKKLKHRIRYVANFDGEIFELN